MDIITLAHGSGGKKTQRLIKDIFYKYFNNDILEKNSDAAIFDMEAGSLAFTTDSFVVKPVFFPGGDIGKISICGTVNDLAVAGATPKYLTCGFIIEEGFEIEELEKIVRSMSIQAKKAKVKIAAGDTKVVEKGASDGIFINTSGVGVFETEYRSEISNIKSGDKIIVTGTMGDHGLAVLSKRKGLEFSSSIISDCAPLNTMLNELIENINGVKFMRDPTRGGLATTLNELATDGEFGILINEEKIPVSQQVTGACELLGLDPMYMANEGKAIIITAPGTEDDVVAFLKKNEYGKDAEVIGAVVTDNIKKVCMKTRYGSVRIVDMLTGEQLPRIC